MSSNSLNEIHRKKNGIITKHNQSLTPNEETKYENNKENILFNTLSLIKMDGSSDGLEFLFNSLLVISA